MSNLETIINNYWENRENINFNDDNIKADIDKILAGIDNGQIRVAEKINDEWQVREWAKKAILLSFRTNEMQLFNGGPNIAGTNTPWYDKVPSKFANWKEEDYKKANFRAVPGCVVRYGCLLYTSPSPRDTG